MNIKYFIAVYIATTALLFVGFRGGKHDLDDMKRTKKSRNRLEWITKSQDGIPWNFKEYSFYGEKRKEKDERTDVVLAMIKKESQAIYGMDFTDKHFSANEKKYRELADNKQIEDIRRFAADAFEKEKPPKNIDLIPRLNETRADSRELSAIDESQVKTPLPESANREQLLILTLSNYLSFSGNIQNFFTLRKKLFNNISEKKDRVFLAEKSSETVFQYYMREVIINKSAMMDIAVTLERELANSGEDMLQYKGVLGGYYYWAGDVKRSLSYQREYYKYFESSIAPVLNGDSLTRNRYNIHHGLVTSEFAMGNINEAYGHLVNCLEYLNDTPNRRFAQYQRGGLLGNILALREYMDSVPPEQALFLGLILKNYQDGAAREHISQYLLTAKDERFIGIARSVLREIGGK